MSKLLAEYHIPAGMTMVPPDEVVRLHRLGQASMQVEFLPSGVQHVRWWYTGPSASDAGGGVGKIVRVTYPDGTTWTGEADIDWSGGPQPVKPYVAPPEPTPEEVAESGAWLITGKGNVYTLSSIGSACTFESLREDGSGYLDSLDADHATPEEVAAIKAHLLRLLG